MSNRVLWVLLLVWIILFLVWLYFVFFVEFTWTLQITSNIESYHVNLFSKKLFKNFEYECDKKVCTIENLSPFDYTITLSAPTYKDIVNDLKIYWKQVNKMNLDFQKDTKLVEMNSIENTSTNSWVIDTTLENDLKDNSYYYKKLDWVWYFYFKENNSNIVLYSNINSKEKALGTFKKVNKEEINIFFVDSSKNKILISLSENKFIYNLDLSSTVEFILKPQINYVKMWDNLASYLVVTNLWTYIYDEVSNTITYFYLFKDFVYLDDNYIGVIYKEERDKMKNFSIPDSWKNVIINYNPHSLDRKVILETDLIVKKIVIENKNKVFFYDDSWKKYELENY